jgi:hypothetical protein
MSNEEFEWKMEFIVNQQAQFAVDIQQLREAQARTEQSVQETQQLVSRLASATLEGFRDVNAKIDALVDSQMRTEGNIRNLTAVVDRYFREHNGRAEG